MYIHDMTYITYAYIYTYITYIHTYIRIDIHTYIHTYIHSYIYTYLHTYIHTYIYAYIHNHIYTYSGFTSILSMPTACTVKTDIPTVTYLNRGKYYISCDCHVISLLSCLLFSVSSL